MKLIKLAIKESYKHTNLQKIAVCLAKQSLSRLLFWGICLRYPYVTCESAVQAFSSDVYETNVICKRFIL